MDYEEITDKLIREVMLGFKLENIYQEFLDSIVTFNEFKNAPNKEIQDYIDNHDF